MGPIGPKWRRIALHGRLSPRGLYSQGTDGLSSLRKKSKPNPAPFANILIPQNEIGFVLQKSAFSIFDCKWAFFYSSKTGN
jgi:hypothetical protein